MVEMRMRLLFLVALALASITARAEDCTTAHCDQSAKDWDAYHAHGHEENPDPDAEERPAEDGER